MTTSHTVAALCHPRSPWPRELARWATTGSVPVTLLTCLSAGELRTLLATGRPLSAVLLDGASPHVDGALVEEVRAVGARPLGVASDDRARTWEELGITCVLGSRFGAAELVAALASSTPPGAGVPEQRSGRSASVPGGGDAGCTLVGVCGSPGAGASVTAMALATALATALGDPDGDPERAPVLLVDAARRGHQALYHATNDVIPSILDVAARSSGAALGLREVTAMTFDTAGPYRLLLGAPNPLDAERLPEESARALLRALAAHHDLLVVDNDGPASAAVARAAAERAGAWVTVAGTDMKGVHDAAAIVLEALAAGIPAQRQLVVLNRTARSGRIHPAAHAIDRLLESVIDAPVRVVTAPTVRMERALRDGQCPPRRFAQPIARAVTELLAQRRAERSGQRGPEELLAAP